VAVPSEAAMLTIGLGKLACPRYKGVRLSARSEAGAIWEKD